MTETMTKEQLQKLIDEAPDGAEIELRVNGELAKPEKQPYKLNIHQSAVLYTMYGNGKVSVGGHDRLLYYAHGKTAPTREQAQLMQRWDKLNMLITSFIADCNAELGWVADFNDEDQLKWYFEWRYDDGQPYCDWCGTHQYNPDIGVYFHRSVKQKILDEFMPQQLSFWLTRVEGLMG